MKAIIITALGLALMIATVLALGVFNNSNIQATEVPPEDFGKYNKPSGKVLAAPPEHIASNISPADPGVNAQYQVVFDTLLGLAANIDTITVTFDKDIGIPTGVSADDVILVSSLVTAGAGANHPVHPVFDPQVE